MQSPRENTHKTFTGTFHQLKVGDHVNLVQSRLEIWIENCMVRGNIKNDTDIKNRFEIISTKDQEFILEHIDTGLHVDDVDLSDIC